MALISDVSGILLIIATLFALEKRYCYAYGNDGYSGGGGGGSYGGGGDSGGGYGGYGYGYQKRYQPNKVTYIYKPMPLPSWASSSPAYGFGQAHGEFEPGVFRPVFHDQYQALKVGFDTNRSPVVVSHLRYVPRLPPPVYGDLGALSQTPIISEDFTTNSTSLEQSDDDDDDSGGDYYNNNNDEGGYGGSSSYGNSGNNNAYEDSDNVSQYQYGPYNNNNTDEMTSSNTSTTSAPSTSTMKGTATSVGASPSTTTTTTTTMTPRGYASSQPDEVPASGFGDELNSDYNYVDVAPYKHNSKPSSAGYGSNGGSGEAYDDFNSNDEENGSGDSGNKMKDMDAANYNKGSRLYGHPPARAAPVASSTPPPAEDEQQQQSEDDNNNSKPDVRKYMLHANDVEGSGAEDSNTVSDYGYKGGSRHGRKQQISADQQQQTNIYRDDTSANTDTNEAQPETETAANKNDKSDGVSSSSSNNAPLDTLPESLAEGSNGDDVTAQQQVEEDTKASEKQQNHDDESEGKSGGRRRHNRRRHHNRHRKNGGGGEKEYVIEIIKDRPTAEAEARALLPEESAAAADLPAPPPPQPRLTPMQKRERDIQMQLESEYNVPQQIVQPYKVAAPNDPTGQTNLEQRFSVPKMLVNDKQAPPPSPENFLSPERRRAAATATQQQPAANMEQAFDVPQNADITISEQRLPASMMTTDRPSRAVWTL